MSEVVQLRPGKQKPELTIERASAAQRLGSLYRRGEADSEGPVVSVFFKTPAEAEEFLRLLDALPDARRRRA